MRFWRLLLLAALLAPPVLAMTVEEAYQSIPHRRTVFDAQAAKMGPADAAYLTQLFAWMDQAIVAKQSVLRGENLEDAYRGVWKALQELRPPSKLKHVQDLYGLAAKDEFAYLQEWKRSQVFSREAPLVNRASGRLIEGYNAMMAIYPTENSHNKEAFFDYPCALDFK